MRRPLPGDQLGPRLPMLALSLFCIVGALVLFAMDRPIGAVTAMLAAFILVAAAKRR